MNTVEPIRDIKTKKNLRSILKAQATRNEILFILGINVGLRISDIPETLKHHGTKKRSAKKCDD